MSKKKFDSFQLCDLCGRLVYSRQSADHRAVCEADSSSDDHKCAFIQDGVLHALVVETNNKMFSGSSDRFEQRLTVSSDFALKFNLGVCNPRVMLVLNWNDRGSKEKMGVVGFF